MASNLSYNFNMVAYYNSEGFEYATAPIVDSPDLKNELLTMLNTKFTDNSKLPAEIISSEELLTNDQLTVLANVGILTSDLEDTTVENDNLEFSTIIGDSKVVALRLPKECVRIRLFRDTNPEDITEIDLINDANYLMTDADKVEKLVVLIMSQKSFSNLSVRIHEHSEKPHDNISDKIMTALRFYDTIALMEIDKLNLIHNKSGMKLGDKLTQIILESEIPSVIHITESGKYFKVSIG